MKPGRWAVSLAEIDPQYLGFWRDLTFFAPYWEGSGRSYDIKGRMSGVLEASSVWGVGESGLTVDFGADNDLINYGVVTDNPDWPVFPDSTSDITVVSVFRAPSGSSFRWMLDADYQSTGPANAQGVKRVFQWRIDTANKVSWIPFHTNTELVVVASSASYADDTWHVAVGRLQGTAATVGVDGVQDGSGTLGTAGINGADSLTVLGSGDEDIDVALNAVWHRALSDAEIRLLQLDPFGPIRPAPILPFDVEVFLALGTVPSDFGNPESAAIVVRVQGQDVLSTRKLYAQLYRFDEATPLSNEVECVSISSDGVWTNFRATLTGVDTSSEKAIWDAPAKVRFRWSSI